MKVMEKNKFRDVQKFSTVKDIIYNSVKLYPNNIAFVTKVKCDDQKVEYINHTYTDLLNDISESDPGEFRLVILNGYNTNSPENSYQPLAQLPVDAYMLARITPGTQAMIEWVMQIRNA